MFSRQKGKIFIITQIIVRLCTWEHDICTWSRVAHGETKQFHLVWYRHICFPVLNDEPFSSLSHWSNGNRGKCISSRGKHKYKDRKVIFFSFQLYISIYVFKPYLNQYTACKFQKASLETYTETLNDILYCLNYILEMTRS